MFKKLVRKYLLFHDLIIIIKLLFLAFNNQFAPAIGFHVALSHDKSNPPSNIEFDVVLHHYGNCWNSGTKMFVAPVTGMYSFQLTILNHYARQAMDTWAVLMYETKILQRTHANGHGSHHHSSASAVVKVNKGEHVYARLTRGVLHSNGYYWCNLVGFLVKKM